MNDWDAFYITLLLVPVVLLVVLIWLFQKRRTIQGKRWLLLTGWNLLMLACLSSLVLAAGETYYRFFVDTTDSFGLTKITKRWEKRHYQFNNYHWRDKVDYVKQKSDKKRITFLGDSFTAGHGVKNVDDRFANLLRARHREWEIHVLASNGFETIDHWDVVQRNDEIFYETDMIVLVYNLNDISWLIPKTRAIYDRIFAFDSSLNYWQRESYFLNLLAFRYQALQDPNIANYYSFVQDSYQGPIWEAQQQQLRQIAQHLKERQIPFKVITFPFLHDLDHYPFTDVHEQLGRFWKAMGVEHLDLLPLFLEHSKEDLVVNDFDAHPNERAHVLVVEEIEGFLRDKK